MKKIGIFLVAIILLAIVIGAVAIAAECKSDNRPQKGANWSFQTEEAESDTSNRESRNFSDEKTFFSRMATYCGRMANEKTNEVTPKNGYSKFSCH
ncbi:MAG: hypothetical protein LBP21_01550 [Synergistaceae bacterium]|jgi:hypothetical protein|nr:hypothetical protein [Synergistaceae bacterium]